MLRRWFFSWIITLGLFGALGFLAWPVTQPVQWICERLASDRNWVITVEEACLKPWRTLELSDVKLVTPQGARMHLVKLGVSQQLFSLLSGSWTTSWQVGEIRLDPASWGVRRPLAQEILSAEPVTTVGSAVVQMESGGVTLKALNLKGPLLQIEAEGWLTRKQQAHLDLEGSVSEKILRGFNLMKASENRQTPWEPFQFKLDGVLPYPAVSFASQFFSISLKSQEKHHS